MLDLQLQEYGILGLVAFAIVAVCTCCRVRNSKASHSPKPVDRNDNNHRNAAAKPANGSGRTKKKKAGKRKKSRSKSKRSQSVSLDAQQLTNNLKQSRTKSKSLDDVLHDTNADQADTAQIKARKSKRHHKPAIVHIEEEEEEKADSMQDILQHQNSDISQRFESVDITHDLLANIDSTATPKVDEDQNNSLNKQILDELVKLNSKFDGLIHAMNQINDTLQSQSPRDRPHPHHQDSGVANTWSVIQIIQFVVCLPFRLIFNIKSILVILVISTAGIYVSKQQISDRFGINIDEIGQWLIDHYIFRQQTMQRYLMQSTQSIDDLQQYHQDIHQRIDVDIMEKWSDYQPKYELYKDAMQKQLFYQQELDDPNIRQLVLIGITGTGKSTFGNRLAGIRNDSGYYFGVSGDVDSCTKNISKLLVKNLYSVNISILDTPGIFDSDDDDLVNLHNLIEYLRGSGGVNSFVLVLKKERLSKFIQSMLQQFEEKFGETFWSHLIFVINFWSTRDEEGWHEWKKEFVERIRKDFKLRDEQKYPLHMVGLNNYGSYMREIERDLIPNVPEHRLNSQHFKSPLDELKKDVTELHERLSVLANERRAKMEHLSVKCSELKSFARSLRWFDEEQQVERIYKEVYEKCDTVAADAEVDVVVEQIRVNDTAATVAENVHVWQLQTTVLDYGNESA